jgi:hypothetical protein
MGSGQLNPLQGLLSHRLCEFDRYRFSGGMVFMCSAKAACAARSTAFETTFVEAGAEFKQFPPFHARAGRMGRALKPPPQLGQTLASSSSTQVRQKVHSKEQIIASRELGNN